MGTLGRALDHTAPNCTAAFEQCLSIQSDLVVQHAFKGLVGVRIRARQGLDKPNRQQRSRGKACPKRHCCGRGWHVVFRDSRAQVWELVNRPFQSFRTSHRSRGVLPTRHAADERQRKRDNRNVPPSPHGSILSDSVEAGQVSRQMPGVHRAIGSACEGRMAFTQGTLAQKETRTASPVRGSAETKLI